MIAFRGQKKVGPRPDWSPLGVLFKISDEHPHPFRIQSLPRATTSPSIFQMMAIPLEVNSKGLVLSLKKNKIKLWSAVLFPYKT